MLPTVRWTRSLSGSFPVPGKGRRYSPDGARSSTARENRPGACLYSGPGVPRQEPHHWRVEALRLRRHRHSDPNPDPAFLVALSGPLAPRSAVRNRAATNRNPCESSDPTGRCSAICNRNA